MFLLIVIFITELYLAIILAILWVIFMAYIKSLLQKEMEKIKFKNENTEEEENEESNNSEERTD